MQHRSNCFHRILLMLPAILLVCGALNLSGQETYTVSGRVIDEKTKQPLAFVNIIVNQNNFNGGTTDIDGKFRISSREPVRSLKLTYVGYLPKTYTPGTRAENLLITLVQKEIELGEVQILPGVNPAHRIIQNAIDRREINDPEKLSTFSYTSYDKTIFTVESDTATAKKPADTTLTPPPGGFTIGFTTRSDTLKNDSASMDSAQQWLDKLLGQQYLFLMENVTKRKFMAPDRNYNQVVATRMSGFKDPMFVFLTTQIQSFSFYKPFITIFQSTYVNPISSGSLSKYFFKIEDTTYSGRDTMFIISFRPKKGTNFDGMKGVITLSSDQWAIVNVIAEPAGEGTGFNIRIQQLYEKPDSVHWFPVQLNTDVTFGQLTIGKNKAIAKGRSYIRDIVLNPDMVRSEFNHLDVEVDKQATERKEDYWNQYRTDSLTAKDRRTYQVIDSIGKEANFDRMAKSLQTIMSGRIPFKFIDFDLNRILGYNTYEGLILGLGVHTNDKIADWFRVGGFYQYSFAVQQSKYGGDFSFLLNRRNDVTVKGGYFLDYVPSGLVSFPDDNRSTLSGNWETLLYKKLDLTENFNLSGSVRFRKYLLVNAGISRSFKKSTSYDLAEREGQATLLYDAFRFTEVTAGFKWAYGEKFLQTVKNKISLGTRYPVIYFQYTRGLKGFLDGEYDYNRFDFRLRKTFHFKYLGKFSVQFDAGYVDRAIPATNLYYGNASYRLITIYAPGTFATMRMNEFLSNKYLALFLYHDFGYMLFKGKKWFHPEFAIAQNIGFGWLDHPEKYAYITDNLKSMDLGYYESGLLVNNLVNLKLYTIGVGAFYRWGPYSFDRTGDNFAYKVSVIFPF